MSMINPVGKTGVAFFIHWQASTRLVAAVRAYLSKTIDETELQAKLDLVERTDSALRKHLKNKGK